MVSDCARAFSGAPESTSSYGGAYRLLRDLTYMIVKALSSGDFESSSAGDFKSSQDRCAALQETRCRFLTAVVLTSVSTGSG